MQVWRMTSNQWGIGICLRRSTIIGDSRWHFWINHGYGTFSITSKENPPVRKRWGFKSKTQLPLFMVWEEYWHHGQVEHASVLFSTSDWRLYWPFNRKPRTYR